MPTAPRKVTTFLMFQGQAEEAMTCYTSLFDDAEILTIDRWGANSPGTEGSVRIATFSLGGQQVMCIDSTVQHAFTFTPSISLYAQCDTEAEIDRLYAALSDGGQPLMPLSDYGFSTKFGWTNDRFGVSWQLNLV
ncbi:VOC family protein [Actinokineospora iranica]|uniref:Glyoxalase superfamily enzyme, possibly 3-demethylubiquinone-9 3-methyltransferase n=1 Tax=Actinokineospora iranica TaxID=1271860 RepID=A0A1G6URK6_9PSEU|nr:VOC family protein [Actinokineospora iranica]SDD43931.1 Glyoxalase superfamily enzyme, possibly 3-demethylubiquinone-9 3-methyltransferase [Actinokineospora iranica]